MIQQDAALAKDIKVLGIAVGDNKAKVDALKAELKIPFPLFPDEKGEIYLTLNRPAVPSTLLITTDGKVALNHDGLIEDFDRLVEKIREILKEQ